MNIPASLKGLTAYIKRAEELDRETSNPDSKIIAYFCRTFAMERGMKLNAVGPDVNPFLMELMDTLEKSKVCVTGVPQEDRRLICEKFAYSIFNKADEEDRAGAADKNTAKTFYAAATFLEILEQFGELDSDIQEKKRYAKYKAADIINSIKSGVRPTPGAPNEEPPEPTIYPQSLGSLSVAPTSPSAPSDFFIPAAPTEIPIVPLSLPTPPFAAPPPPPVRQTPYQPPAAQYTPAAASPAYTPQAHYAPAPAPVPAPAPAPVAVYSAVKKPAGPPTSAADPRAKDAIELTSFALAALKHNDIALARERLQMALQRLG